MHFTIILPFFNGSAYIEQALAVIPNDTPIIIADAASEYPLGTEIFVFGHERGFTDLRIFRTNQHGNLAHAVNEAIKECETDILLLRQDCEVKDIQIALSNINNQINVAISGLRLENNAPEWVSADFAYLKRDALNTVGSLVEADFSLWGSLCEWQLRACRKGYRVQSLKQIETATFLSGSPTEYKFEPLVSVVVPAYNHGKYLRDLLHSLLGGKTSLGEFRSQTLQAFEIIVVDDCSTDDTAAVMTEYADPWKMITYVKRRNNGGSAASMNTGCSLAQGHFIARMDADDMRESTSLDNLYRTCIANPHRFAYDNLISFSNGKRRLDTQGKVKVWKLSEYDFESILVKNTIPCNIMFPRQAFIDTGGYPENMNKGREDWAFAVALGVKGYCGIHVTTPGYLYRREGQNRTLINTSPEWKVYFEQQMRMLFKEIYLGRRPMGCCGGSRTVAASNGGLKTMSAMSASDTGPAPEGLTTVEYIGGSAGSQTIYGPVTGLAYTFSASKPRRYVDNRDLHTENGRGLLDLVDRKHKVFREVTASELKKVVSAAVAEAAAEIKEQKAEIKAAEAEVKAVEAEIKAAEAAAEALVPELTDISGIGEVVAKKLKSAGYGTLALLADAQPEDIAEILGWKLERVQTLQETIREML